MSNSRAPIDPGPATPDGPVALRSLLAGGDRRSIAHSNEALALLRADPSRVAELVRLAGDDDWLVVMRALDLLEKLAHEHPEWVQPFKALFVGPLAEHPAWEVRLQIARALPLLQWTRSERKRAVAVLLAYVRGQQKFVRAWSLDSLSQLATGDAALRQTVEVLTQEFEQSDSAALRSRARHVRRRLGTTAAGPQL